MSKGFQAVNTEETRKTTYFLSDKLNIHCDTGWNSEHSLYSSLHLLEAFSHHHKAEKFFAAFIVVAYLFSSSEILHQENWGVGTSFWLITKKEQIVWTSKFFSFFKIVFLINICKNYTMFMFKRVIQERTACSLVLHNMKSGKRRSFKIRGTDLNILFQKSFPSNFLFHYNL